jgi:hypothetical protein
LPEEGRAPLRFCFFALGRRFLLFGAMPRAYERARTIRRCRSVSPRRPWRFRSFRPGRQAAEGRWPRRLGRYAVQPISAPARRAATPNPRSGSICLVSERGRRLHVRALARLRGCIRVASRTGMPDSSGDGVTPERSVGPPG